MSEQPRRSAPTTAMKVANWFIDKSKKEGKEIDQLKLYKLVYYAHAWHLGNGNGPLFEEDIEAWQWGPVIREVYNEFKRYKKSPIKKPGRTRKFEGGKLVFNTLSYKGDLEEFFEMIWNTYKEYTGIQLSNSTHEDGEPWRIVKDEQGLDDSPIILNEIIREVYEKKVKNATA